jgi:acyl transferase domain-containing protein
LPLSAKSSSALQRTAANLTDYLAEQPDLELTEVAYTLQAGRATMPHRSIVVAESVADAVGALENPEAGRIFSGEAPANGRAVAFMFAGGGAQYPNMGAELYRGEPVYRDAVDECLDLLGSMVEYDLKPLLYPAPGDEAEAARQLERPSITLPALFTTQYAQTKLWASWGVEPEAMIGHSMGEYTAAHFAGVFDLRDALALVLLRGQLFERVPEGGMLSVPLGAEALEAIMDERLSIAAINGPELSVASGPVEAIEQLEATLTERDIDSVRVRISIAAHSTMLEGILEEFEAFFQNVTLSPPQLPFVSNLSGKWITPEEATDPSYWVRHLRNTVRFADGVAELFAGDRALLEVGPGRTLATLARQCPGRPEGSEPVNSMRHPDDETSDQAFMLTALGRLWLAGAHVDWSALHGTELPRRVPLPAYPFERQRHWVEPGTQTVPSVQTGEDEDPLAKRTDVHQWSYQPVWHRVPCEQNGPDGQSSIRALICGGPDTLAEALEDRLVGEGHEVLRVHRSDEYAEDPSGSIRLDPSEADHWNKLVSGLGASGRTPQWIFYLWPTTDEAGPAGDIEGTLQTSFYGPLYLAQALGNEAIDDEIRLALVSNRVYRVAGESVLEPAKATLQGPCRVIPREFPNITCVHADVELPQGAAWKTAHLAEQLVRELGDGVGEEVVAYRGTDRWVQRFDEVTLPDDGPGRLRDQGVYLITGGLGGIGLTLAEHLARTHQARLVLLGRTGVPPREEWDDWTTHHGHDHAVSRKIDGIRAVEAAGGEVLALSVDVTDPAAMRAAVAKATERFGTLHGVFHTAGVLEDGVIQLKEPEVAARVLAPKVMGTVALDAALADVPVDFVVLFSSVSAFSGLAGQVDYTAANAFLDAWAHHQLAAGGPPTVAINWSAWRDVGMAADMARQLGITHDDEHESAGTPVDHPLLDRCVLDGRDERVYLTSFSVASHWLLAEHRLHDGDALIPGTGYLELARAAFEQHPQSRPVDMQDVAFLSPFVVSEDEERELRVTVKRNGHSASEFVIASRQPNGNGAQWQEHVRGTIGYSDDAPSDAGDPTLIRARCDTGGRTTTSQQDPVHLDFGPRWQNIERISYGDGEALMDLALPEAFTDDLEWFGLHPAVMDMATAGARQLIPDLDDDEDFYVPLSYGRLTASGPLPQRVHSHLRYREDMSTAKEFAVFDITIMDEEGRPVVDIAEFIMIRVRDKALLAASTAEDGMASSGESGSGRPQSTANNILSVSLEAGIRPVEGMTALEMVLSHSAVPQSVVSTQRLDALIDLLRTPIQPEAPAARRPSASAEPRRDLSPVETALAEHEAVTEAAAREFEERPGDWRLIAYVVYDPEEDATVSELRRHIRRSLSDDFVPHAFIELETIPRSPDGNVDYAALESPFAGAEELVEPRTPSERTIAALWQKLLGVDTIGVYDNFFDIGGHSLLSMRLISQVDKQLGVRLQHEHIVINTLEQLAAKCDQQLGNAPDTADVAAESGVA